MVAPRFRSRPEDKEIEQIRYASTVGAFAAWNGNRWRRELSRGDGADRVCRARTEDIDAQLLLQAPVDAGETYLQKNLWSGAGTST